MSNQTNTNAAMDALLAALDDINGGGVEVSTVTMKDGKVVEENTANASSSSTAASSAPKGLEALMMILGKQLEANRKEGNGDDWVGKPAGGGSVLSKPSSAPTTAAATNAPAVALRAEETSLDDLVIKVQQQLREGGEGVRCEMLAKQQEKNAHTTQETNTALPPPKTREEYDAMSLGELCEELAKVQGAGVKLV